MQVKLLVKLVFITIFLLARHLCISMNRKVFLQVSSDDFQIAIFLSVNRIMILVESRSLRHFVMSPANLIGAGSLLISAAVAAFTRQALPPRVRSLIVVRRRYGPLKGGLLILCESLPKRTDHVLSLISRACS